MKNYTIKCIEIGDSRMKVTIFDESGKDLGGMELAADEYATCLLPPPPFGPTVVRSKFPRGRSWSDKKDRQGD